MTSVHLEGHTNIVLVIPQAKRTQNKYYIIYTRRDSSRSRYFCIICSLSIMDLDKVGTQHFLTELGTQPTAQNTDKIVNCSFFPNPYFPENTSLHSYHPWNTYILPLTPPAETALAEFL